MSLRARASWRTPRGTSRFRGPQSRWYNGALEVRCLNHLKSALAKKSLGLHATEVVVFDVRTLPFADYFVVCTGDNERQLNAIWDAVLEALKARGVLPIHKEGPSGSGWLLADFGAVVVHIFAPEEREFYQLEQLWKDAVPVLRIQ